MRSDHEPQLVCGHFAFDPHADHLLLDTLSSHLHIRNDGDAAGNWMENTLMVIDAETGREQMGDDLIALKLSEIIFAQALRVYLNSDGANRPVLAGFSDPSISRALTEIHQKPAFGWTLDAFARIKGMSRTSFATRFARHMTMTPMGYITHWRMQIARQMLANSNDPIIENAKSVGYRSGAAFSRAFKKHHREAPATFRRNVRLTA